MKSAFGSLRDVVQSIQGYGCCDPTSSKAGSGLHPLGQAYCLYQGIFSKWTNLTCSLGTQEAAGLLSPALVSCPVPPELTGTCTI